MPDANEQVVETKTDYQKAQETKDFGYRRADEPQPEIKPDVKEEKPEEKPEVKPEVPAFDFETAYKGKFKSVEEFEKFLVEHDEIKTKYGTLEQEYNKFKETSHIEVNNEKLYKIQALAEKTKSDDYGFLGKVITVDLDTADKLEVIKMKQLLDDDFISDRSLHRKYKVDKPEDFDDLDPKEKEAYELEVEEKEALLKRDHRKAAAAIKELRDGIKLPERVDVQKQRQEKVGQLKEAWMPKINDVASVMDKVTVSVPVDKDNKLQLEIEIPNQKAKEQAVSEMINHIYGSLVEPTDDNIGKLKEVLTQRILLLEQEYILGEVAKKVRAMTDEQWRKATVNPSAKVSADIKPEDKELTDYQKYKQQKK